MTDINLQLKTELLSHGASLVGFGDFPSCPLKCAAICPWVSASP